MTPVNRTDQNAAAATASLTGAHHRIFSSATFCPGILSPASRGNKRSRLDFLNILIIVLTRQKGLRAARPSMPVPFTLRRRPTCAIADALSAR